MRSDVWCTNCGSKFIAELDLELNGNHEIICPHCQHVHYRVVRDGVVTEDRWRSSAGPTIAVNTYTISTWAMTTASSYDYSTANLWLNRSDLTTF